MLEVILQVPIKFYLTLGITELCELKIRLETLFNHNVKCSKAPNVFFRVLFPCTHVAWKVSFLSTYFVTRISLDCVTSAKQPFQNEHISVPVYVS